MMAPNKNRAAEPLLSMRTALVLLLAMLGAAAVTGLLILDGRSVAAACAVGLGALAGGTKFFHWLIGREKP